VSSPHFDAQAYPRVGPSLLVSGVLLVVAMIGSGGGRGSRGARL